MGNGKNHGCPEESLKPTSSVDGSSPRKVVRWWACFLLGQEAVQGALERAVPFKTCWQCGQSYASGQGRCPRDGAQLVSIRAQPEPDLMLGSVVADRYVICEHLGDGGMARVYAAEGLSTKRPVALKFLRSVYVRDTTMRERFVQEARLLSRLSHPNIVRLYDFGETEEGRFYMVMELLRGERLADRAGRRAVTYREVFAVLVPICSALEAAHRRGIVHRDIKPHNILLAKSFAGSEIPKLIDFGVAKELRGRGLTGSGVACGTPAYMSPEQQRGERVTAATDVYALGVIMHLLHTGTLPRARSSRSSPGDGSPGRATPCLAQQPRPLMELITDALDPVPTRRPACAGEFLQRLTRLCAPVISLVGWDRPAGPGPCGEREAGGCGFTQPMNDATFQHAARFGRV